MTVMFTDIQGFTDLSERLEDHKLTELLNYYLDEMSSLVFANDGHARQVHRRRDHELLERADSQPDHAVRALSRGLGDGTARA